MLKGQGIFSPFDARRLGLFIDLFIYLHGRCKYQNEQLLGEGFPFFFFLHEGEDVT